MNLGENIYRLRTEKNLSQGDLADALDVSRQSVSKWENNSAVPELEKLIRMAQIFDITIDELVTGEPPHTEPSPAITEDRIIYVEKAAPASLSGWKLLGAILAIGAFLLAIFLSTYRYTFSLEEIALLTIPLGACGIVCLVCKHPLLGFSWTGSIGYWFYLFVLSYRWEEQGGFLLLGVILLLAALFYTIHLHRKGTIHVQPWIWGLLTLLLAGAALLLLINLIPPMSGVATPVKPASFN